MTAGGPPPVRDTPASSTGIPAAPSLEGQVLDGRYKILRKLGEGGMGEVYAAEHIHIEKKFAIKLLRPEIVSNQEAVQRFRQEARSSSSIGHRNIIAIEDFGSLPDGRIYMCMELLNGAALNDLIQTPQPVDRLLNIMIQTGHGLAAAHAKGIVHRDMKPENVFVTIDANNQDVPKLLDFGIAKVAGNDGQNNLTRTGTIFGTPFYMAPEQALGNPVDARTDIYAVGVIMYELFAGSLPFQGESFMGILTQHITTEPEPVAQRAQKANRHLPPGLADIITRCMQKNPAQRFSTMDELVNALVQIYRGVAGPGMSTYMEAFPVSARMPAPTPPPLTGPISVPTANPNMATVAAPPPPGHAAQMHPSAGYPMPGPMPGPMPPHYTPQPTPAVSSSSSGLYDPSSSVVQKPKSKVGLIVALIVVAVVGAGIAVLVVMSNKKKTQNGDGPGTGVASGTASEPPNDGPKEMTAAAFFDDYQKNDGKSLDGNGFSKAYPNGVVVTGVVDDTKGGDGKQLRIGGDPPERRLHLSFYDSSTDGAKANVGDTITVKCKVSGADVGGIGLAKCELKNLAAGSTKIGSGDPPPVVVDAGDVTPPPAIDAGSASVPPQTIDAGVTTPEVKMVKIKLMVKGGGSFDVFDGKDRVLEGPGDLEIKEGETKNLVIKAKGFKDKSITVDGKKKKLEFKLDKVGGTTPVGSGSQKPDNPPKLNCAEKLIDASNAACKKQYCDKHPDDFGKCGLQ